MAGQQIRYAELTCTPYTSVRHGHPGRGLLRGDRGCPGRGASATSGSCLRWCFDIPGESGVPAADETIADRDRARPRRAGRLRAWRARRSGCRAQQFKPHFDRARAAGLHSVPHAGETTGPETIWDSIRYLGAERIGHGTSATQDPELLDVPRRARHHPRGLPDLQHRHARGRRAGRAPAGRHGRGGRAGHDQLRRPADVRRHPQRRVRRRGRSARPRPGRASPTWPAPSVTASFADDATKARVLAEIDAYAG